LERNISFLKYRLIAFGFSFALLTLFSVSTYLNDGLNMGIDFIGGVKLIVKFEDGVDSSHIRKVLTEKNLNAQVQQMGKEDKNEYIVAMKLLGEEERGPE